jgi:hypothetical protein
LNCSPASGSTSRRHTISTLDAHRGIQRENPAVIRGAQRLSVFAFEHWHFHAALDCTEGAARARLNALVTNA